MADLSTATNLRAPIAGTEVLSMFPMVFLLSCLDASRDASAPAPFPPASVPPEGHAVEAPAQDAGPVDDAASPAAVLASLSGRSVWMVNASSSSCADAEGLGLLVTCDQERVGTMREEVVSWCPEVSREMLQALGAALGVQAFVVRSWADRPGESAPEECGTFAEITIRY